MNTIVRSVKWIKTAALSCFKLFCTLVMLHSMWAKTVFVHLGVQMAKRYWTVFGFLDEDGVCNGVSLKQVQKEWPCTTVQL